MLSSKGCRGRTSDAMFVRRRTKYEANVIGNECQMEGDYGQTLMSLLPAKPSHREDREAKCTMSR